MIETKDKCDNALLKECFFEIIADSSEDYACKICRAASSTGSTKTIKCRPNSGYSNLTAHLTGVHKGTYDDVFKKFKQDRLKKKRGESSGSSSGGTMDGYMVSLYTKKTVNIYGWLEWIIDSKTVLPFSFVDDPQFR